VWHLILPILLVAGSQAADELLKYYEYDRSLPLNATMEKIGEEETFVVYKVYYDSANRVRVPALLVVPKVGKPPYPCIVFLHGYGGRKEDAIPLARVAAPRGYACLLDRRRAPRRAQGPRQAAVLAGLRGNLGQGHSSRR
jgi:cephalosporin-C deacetylase-like acetyl esterase